MTDRATEVLGTLMGRPLVADPFPLYHELREIDPVHREENGLWYLTRFADCDRVFRSASFGHGDGETHNVGVAGRRSTLLSLMFSFDDPPVHTRKRGLVAEPFTAAYTADTDRAPRPSSMSCSNRSCRALTSISTPYCRRVYPCLSPASCSAFPRPTATAASVGSRC